MSWLALLLLGAGTGDLVAAAIVESRWRRPAGVVAGIAAVVAFASLGDLGRSLSDVVGVVAVSAAVVLWLVTHDTRRRGMAWLPLAALIGGTAACVVAAGSAPAVHGPFGRWVADMTWPTVALHDPDRAMLLLGAFLVQLSTGNLVVRLVLLATGTLKGANGHDDDASTKLRGGRLLGPMERLLILGLGLANDYTAAGVVIAAKGLLRFPELQAVRADAEGPGIDEVTEYFLVGSFLSWLLAFATLALVHG
jgi:hypothetical protein